MGKFSKLFRATCALGASLLLANCVTTGSNGPASAVDQAIGQCFATVLGGALIGALIGETSSGKAGKGAAIGAAAGGATCAVLLALASSEDKAQIRAQQSLAAASNHAQSTRYINGDGKQVVMNSMPSAKAVPSTTTDNAYQSWAPPGAVEETRQESCQRISSRADGRILSEDDVALVCQRPDGSWATVNGAEYNAKIAAFSGPSPTATATALSAAELPEVEKQCRYISTEIAVEDAGEAELTDIVVCRQPDGKWTEMSV